MNLAERDRDGVVVDICTACRGLWLDRGELEKLLRRADDTPPEGLRYDSHREGVRYDRHRDDDRRYPKKRRLIETLVDLFD